MEIIIIIMDFIKRPILVIPFLKCCTYKKKQEYKIVTKIVKIYPLGMSAQRGKFLDTS